MANINGRGMINEIPDKAIMESDRAEPNGLNDGDFKHLTLIEYNSLIGAIHNHDDLYYTESEIDNNKTILIKDMDDYVKECIDMEFIRYEKELNIIFNPSGRNYSLKAREMSRLRSSQEATNKAFGIVHCDGTNVSDILWFGCDTPIPELLSRSYVSNVTDCYTLARDYYKHYFAHDNLIFFFYFFIIFH